MKNVVNQLQLYCDVLMDTSSSWGMRRQQLEHIHTLFKELGAWDAYKGGDQYGTTTSSGANAIAPAWAGMCLFDMTRTREFIGGIKLAIKDKIAEGSLPVQLLDAGCGPYALLSLLPALYFSPEEIQLTVLDIHEDNISSVKRLVNALKMNAYFREITCTDVLQYEWPLPQPPHIVVTETMNRALSKEPQVAISIHVSKSLDEKGILIPQAIEVDLVQVDIAKENKWRMAEAGEEIKPADLQQLLGNIIHLDRNTTMEEISMDPLIEITLLQNYHPSLHQLELQTQVTIYKEYRLENKDAAITLPVILHNEKLMLAAGDTLRFHYQLQGEPCIMIQ